MCFIWRAEDALEHWRFRNSCASGNKTVYNIRKYEQKFRKPLEYVLWTSGKRVFAGRKGHLLAMKQMTEKQSRKEREK